jgi:hypothetical protein
VLWVSPWQDPTTITEVVHPKHKASSFGFALDDAWLNQFWLRMADINAGIRVQVHTHPGAAFHSATDDAYPIVHEVGFLSLVIPNFGLGPIDLADTYLAQITDGGRWEEISCKHLLII